MNAVHLAAHTKMCAEVDAQRRRADDAVEQEVEVRGIGGVRRGDELGLVGEGLRDVGIEVAHQADVVVGEGVGR